MLNTTPNSPALESIHVDALLFVSGGCHKRCCGPCQPVNQQTIVNVPPSPAPQAVPQVAPAPAPAPAPSGPTGDVVTTNVSINGQPVS